MRVPILWILTLLLAYPLIGRAVAQCGESRSSDLQIQDTATPVTDATLSEGQQTTQEPSVRGSGDLDASKSEATESQTPEKRKLRLRFGGLAVGAGYTHFSGPFYPYYPYGPYAYYPGDWYGASFWSPLWSPYPYYGPGFFAYNNGRGEVRLTADPKLAEVYIDGGYAGTADKLKTLWLDPGAYDLTVSSAGHESFHQRVYVLSGKSLKITAKLNAESGENKR